MDSNNLGFRASFTYLRIAMGLTCGLRVYTSKSSKNMCDRAEPGGGRGYGRSTHPWLPPFADHRDFEAHAIRPASSARCKDLSAPLDKGDQQYMIGALDLLYAGVDGLRYRPNAPRRLARIRIRSSAGSRPYSANCRPTA
jgi:hypothetical protein